MRIEHKVILVFIESYLSKNPSCRFGQALLNLNINEFIHSGEPGDPSAIPLKNNCMDTDAEIIHRIEKSKKTSS